MMMSVFLALAASTMAQRTPVRKKELSTCVYLTCTLHLVYYFM